MVNGSLESLKILNVALPGACQRSVPNSWRTLSKRTCAETLAVADKPQMAAAIMYCLMRCINKLKVLLFEKEPPAEPSVSDASTGILMAKL